MVGYISAASRLHYLRGYLLRDTHKQILTPSVRNFSVGLQRPRAAVLAISSISTLGTRNIWGSSSSSNASSISSTIPSHDRPTAQGPISSPSVEEVVAADTPEPIWSNAVESNANTNEPISSIVPNDTFLSNVTPDAISPLQYGDFANLGLAGWTPAGFVRWSLEIIHVSTAMPWFWTIVGGTVFWRLVLVPLSVSMLRTTSIMARVGPEVGEVQKKMQAAAASGDPSFRKEAALEMSKVYRDAGINPMTMLLSPLIQIPVGMGVFFGIKKMCELPLDQLRHSGLDLLPDLTIATSVADPYYIMPILAAVLMNVQMKLGARDTDPNKPQALHTMNILRVMFPIFAYGMSVLPVGLMVSILTGIGVTVVQSAVLQRTVIRRLLGIPVLPANPPKLPSFRESRAAFYKMLEEQQRAAEIEAKTRTRK